MSTSFVYTYADESTIDGHIIVKYQLCNTNDIWFVRLMYHQFLRKKILIKTSVNRQNPNIIVLII